MASVGILKMPTAVPLLEQESGKSIAIRFPFSPHRYHFVIFPKRDIRNIGELSPEDQPYVIDSLALIGDLIRKYNLKSYRVYSNGPVEQDITYLHFHLVSD